jgi:hypothetical protein
MNSQILATDNEIDTLVAHIHSYQSPQRDYREQVRRLEDLVLTKYAAQLIGNQVRCCLVVFFWGGRKEVAALNCSILPSPWHNIIATKPSQKQCTQNIRRLTSRSKMV